ncbi:hypothetical protein BCR42DRAFT_443916 [Absidia repens]|uniref:Uncharacterized protein n=1 Tax=Absidia repens TaxID=90262 RepID=A0A1X2HZG5_9FUNG|nr:hypothetical protein BCR42DRAFT_443916 [Absidia repens]
MFRRKTIKHEPLLTLPKRDQYVLDKYTRRMKTYDEMFYVCCCWVGYDVLLEFIPVIGKVISLGFSLSMYRLACQADLPKALRRRMLYHISVDFLLGLIPILGILLDALYRAHSKNTKLLRKYLYQRARENNELENPSSSPTQLTETTAPTTSTASYTDNMNSTPMESLNKKMT